MLISEYHVRAIPPVHRRSQGVQWVHLHPQGVEKIFSGLIYRKMCKCTPGHEVHPQPKQGSIFRPVYAGWLRLEVYLDAILRATTKKIVNFFGEKSAPPDKILATPMLLSMGDSDCLAPIL